MYKIAVLMSTYNGEKYVVEQIESILNQQEVDVVLYARDDGSSDRTPEILDSYENNYSNFIWINKGIKENIGVKKSFFNLLDYAYSTDESVEYFSFADQDDVWLERKLISAINKIKNSNNEKGAVYYSNKIFVDEKLKEISRENIIYYGDYLEILWKCLSAGCTMVFNRRMADKLNIYRSEVNCLHDAWVYRLGKCIGADFFFDNKSYILYRQHGNNVLGQKSTIMIDSSKENVIGAIRRRLSHREHIYQNVIKEIYRLAKFEMGEKEIENTEIVLNYNRSIKDKIKMLRFDGIEKRNIKLRMLWVDKVINNMI